MDNDPKREADEVQAAFERMLDVLRASKTGSGWKYQAIGRLGDIRVMVKEYRLAMIRESHLVSKGVLTEKDKPRHPREGFIDGAHSVEYQVAAQMNDLLTSLERQDMAEADRTAIMGQFRALAVALANTGIYLDQGKQFAHDSTLPADPDVPGGPAAGGIFRRLNPHTADGKNR